MKTEANNVSFEDGNGHVLGKENVMGTVTDFIYRVKITG